MPVVVIVAGSTFVLGYEGKQLQQRQQGRPGLRAEQCMADATTHRVIVICCFFQQEGGLLKVLRDASAIGIH